MHLEWSMCHQVDVDSPAKSGMSKSHPHSSITWRIVTLSPFAKLHIHVASVWCIWPAGQEFDSPVPDLLQDPNSRTLAFQIFHHHHTPEGPCELFTTGPQKWWVSTSICIPTCTSSGRVCECMVYLYTPWPHVHSTCANGPCVHMPLNSCSHGTISSPPAGLQSLKDWERWPSPSVLLLIVLFASFLSTHINENSIVMQTLLSKTPVTRTGCTLLRWWLDVIQSCKSLVKN